MQVKTSLKQLKKIYEKQLGFGLDAFKSNDLLYNLDKLILCLQYMRDKEIITTDSFAGNEKINTLNAAVVEYDLYKEALYRQSINKKDESAVADADYHITCMWRLILNCLESWFA